MTLVDAALGSSEGSFGLAACSLGSGGSGGGGVKNGARQLDAGTRAWGRVAVEGLVRDSGVGVRSWDAAALGGETMAVVAWGIGVRWITTGAIVPLAAWGWRFDQLRSSSITRGSAGRLKMSKLPSDWMANGTVAGEEMRSDGT